MVKPGDFYLGISDFFSVLLPGFITTSSVMIYLNITEYATLGANEWIALLVAIYMSYQFNLKTNIIHSCLIRLSAPLFCSSSCFFGIIFYLHLVHIGMNCMTLLNRKGMMSY